MRRLLRSGRRALTTFCLRPLWQSLVALGAVQSGPLVYYHAVPAPVPDLPPHGLWVPYVPQSVGPPPGHPERVCAEVPLTAQERLLERELRLPQGLRRRHGRA